MDTRGFFDGGCCTRMLPKLLGILTLLREEAELDKSELTDLTDIGEVVFMGLMELGELAFVEVVVLLDCGFCNNVDVGLSPFGGRVRFPLPLNIL